jgi:hypothetical protein
MKTLLSSRRDGLPVEVCLFLIIAALAAGMAGCDGNGGDESYMLTIASTAGGSVSTPGEDTFTYSSGIWSPRLRKATALSTGPAMWRPSPMSTPP